MEPLTLTLRNAGRFDAVLEETRLTPSPEVGGTLEVITKERATASGKPAVMVTFEVMIPDGGLRQLRRIRVQAVTTAQLFVMAGDAVRAAHGL